MQKIPCSVIRDLLVLYEDDVCSKETKQMIEEHIADCEECREIYEKTKQNLPEIEDEPNLMRDVWEGFQDDKRRMKREAAEQWRIIERAFRKIKIQISIRMLMVIGAVMLVLSSGVSFWKLYLEPRVDRVPYEDLKITEMYELSNGDIYCTFEAKEKFLYTELNDIQTPEGKAFEDCDEAWHEIYFQYPHFYEKDTLEEILNNKVSFVFPRSEEVRQTPQIKAKIHEVATIYYNRKGEKDAVAIWEEGQKLPKAPEELEEKVTKEIEEYHELVGDVSDWQWAFSMPIEIP